MDAPLKSAYTFAGETQLGAVGILYDADLPGMRTVLSGCVCQPVGIGNLYSFYLKFKWKVIVDLASFW